MKSKILPTLNKLFVVTIMLTLMVGCATAPFQALPHAVMAEMGAEQLLQNWWLQPGHKYLCRHSGLIEVFGHKFPLDGVAKIDTTTHTARLIAMNPMGVKLFDLAITQHSYELNYLLPELQKYPQMPQMVAQSMQTIFLAFNPAVTDELIYDKKHITLHSQNDADVVSTFAGNPVRLIKKTVVSSSQSYSIDYYQYVEQNSVWSPTGIVLNDDSGFKLTLWIDEIRELL